MIHNRWQRRPDEIPGLLARWAAPAFLQARILTVVFQTDPEVAAAALPPPLELDGPGIASAFVATFGDSNCVGPFDGGALNIRARYGDVRGVYCVTMPMSTDTAVVFGRELYGEPKKLARVSLLRTENHVSGSVERHGFTYLRLSADLTAREEPSEAAGSTFHVRALPRPDGTGLEPDPQLILVSSRTVLRRIERGTGNIELLESPFDPVADIPVQRVLSAGYSEGDVYTSARVLATLAAESFLPWALGKIDPLDAAFLQHAPAGGVHLIA